MYPPPLIGPVRQIEMWQLFLLQISDELGIIFPGKDEYNNWALFTYKILHFPICTLKFSPFVTFVREGRISMIRNIGNGKCLGYIKIGNILNSPAG